VWAPLASAVNRLLSWPGSEFGSVLRIRPEMWAQYPQILVEFILSENLKSRFHNHHTVLLPVL
jgi:hypothetical protein